MNARPTDWNRCGQAAVATVLAHFRLGPFGAAITNDAAMDRISADFPPDVPFGLGSSAWRLRAALESHGLEVDHVHSGWFGQRGDRAMRRLEEHLERGQPAIVCLDQGRCGGDAWTAHWAVAVALRSRQVTLAAPRGSVTMRLEPFMDAWRCRHLPYAHNHCALLARPGLEAVEKRHPGRAVPVALEDGSPP